MVKFNNEAVEVLNNPKFNGVTVGEYIRLRGYSEVSTNHLHYVAIRTL